jgi:hypothetical protein
MSTVVNSPNKHAQIFKKIFRTIDFIDVPGLSNKTSTTMIAGIKIIETDLENDTKKKPKNCRSRLPLNKPIIINTLDKKNKASEYGNAQKMSDGVDIKTNNKSFLTFRPLKSVRKPVRKIKKLMMLINKASTDRIFHTIGKRGKNARLHIAFSLYL